MKFIQDNGGILAVGAVVVLVGGYFGNMIMDVKVGKAVEAKLLEAGIVPTHRVVAIEEDVQHNEESIEGLETRWNNIVDAVATAGRINE